MKAIKILIKAVVVIAILAVLALLAMPVWFGPVVKTTANSVAPSVLKTDFHLGHLSLNPYTARFELGDMQLSNPEGYSEKYAATVGEVAFDAETLSLMTDVIHIEEIKVKDVFVSIVSKDGVGNFKQIQYNLAGGKEKYEAAQAKKEAEKPAEAEKSAEAPSEKKVIIDHLEISGIKIKLGILPITIPVAIKLDDIGRKSGGATFAEVWEQVVAEVMKAAGAVGDQLKALGGFAGDAAKQATEAATKAAAQATESVSKAAESATKVVGDATKSVGAVTESATKVLGGAAGGATKAVSDVTEGATKAVGGAAEGATKAVGDGAKAVGDGAKKALDSLKSLW